MPEALLATPEMAAEYGTPRSGPFHGSVVNPDTGKPILTSDDQLRRADFRKVKHSELILPESFSLGTAKARLPFYSALWQADNAKIPRMAPMEFIGRYLEEARHAPHFPLPCQTTTFSRCSG